MASRVACACVGWLLVGLGCNSGNGGSDASAGTTGIAAGGGGAGGGVGESGGATAGAGGAGGGGAGGSGGGAGGGNPIDVKGTVFNKFDIPFPAVNVRIGSAVTQTAADGSFEIDGVVPPYDMDVWTTPPGSATNVSHYVGLTRPDPAAHLYIYIQPPHSSTINVTLSTALAGDEVANCQFANPARSWRMGIGVGGLVGPGSTFSMMITWHTNGASASGALSCLAYKNNALNPTGYVSFGSVPLKVNDGATAAVSLPMTPVTTGTLMVNLAPGAATSVSIRGELLVDGGARHPVGQVGTPITSNPAPVAIPQVAGTTVRLIANGSTPNGGVYSFRSGFPTAGTVDMALPQPIAFTSPANKATMVDTGTALSWSAPAGTLASVRLGAATGGGASYLIYTTRGSATIPDLSAQGVPLPSGSTYDWTVNAFGPAASVDAMTGPDLDPCLADVPGSCDAAATSSWSFTTR